MDQQCLARLERVKVAIAHSLQLWGHDHVWVLDHCETLIEQVKHDNTAARLEAILAGTGSAAPTRRHLTLIHKRG